MRIMLRLDFGDRGRFGPGKAALLEALDREGSISAAGRALGISYRRAWTLLEEANRVFHRPLFETATGGAHGGGAALTPLGREVLARYRALEAATRAQADEAFAGLPPARHRPG